MDGVKKVSWVSEVSRSELTRGTSHGPTERGVFTFGD
jgi:hypothetical protein